MIKSWKNSDIDLGVLKPYQKITIIFECLESLQDAVTITSSCGCSSGHVSGNTVVASFKAGDVPKHLLKAGSAVSNFRKNLKVFFKDGKYDLLQFHGKVKR